MFAYHIHTDIIKLPDDSPDEVRDKLQFKIGLMPMKGKDSVSKSEAVNLVLCTTRNLFQPNNKSGIIYPATRPSSHYSITIEFTFQGITFHDTLAEAELINPDLPPFEPFEEGHKFHGKSATCEILFNHEYAFDLIGTNRSDAAYLHESQKISQPYGSFIMACWSRYSPDHFADFHLFGCYARVLVMKRGPPPILPVWDSWIWDPSCPGLPSSCSDHSPYLLAGKGFRFDPETMQETSPFYSFALVQLSTSYYHKYIFALTRDRSHPASLRHIAGIHNMVTTEYLGNPLLHPFKTIKIVHDDTSNTNDNKQNDNDIIINTNDEDGAMMDDDESESKGQEENIAPQSASVQPTVTSLSEFPSSQQHKPSAQSPFPPGSASPSRSASNYDYRNRNRFLTYVTLI